MFQTANLGINFGLAAHRRGKLRFIKIIKTGNTALGAPPCPTLLCYRALFFIMPNAVFHGTKDGIRRRSS